MTDSISPINIATEKQWILKTVSTWNELPVKSARDVHSYALIDDGYDCAVCTDDEICVWAKGVKISVSLDEINDAIVYQREYQTDGAYPLRWRSYM